MIEGPGSLPGLSLGQRVHSESLAFGKKGVQGAREEVGLTQIKSAPRLFG